MASFLNSLRTNEFFPLRIIEKTWKSRDSLSIKMALPSQDMVLGLPVGQHILLRYLSLKYSVEGILDWCLFWINRDEVDGKEVIRSYTPVSGALDKGFLEVILKICAPSAGFLQGGLLTNHIERKNVHPGPFVSFFLILKIGETIQVAGPCGQFLYQGKGKIQALNREKELILEGVFSNIGFIAGGCGITAPFQLIKYLTEVEKDEKMRLKLLFANRSKADILLREELDDLQKKNPNLEIHYILSEVFFISMPNIINAERKRLERDDRPHQ